MTKRYSTLQKKLQELQSQILRITTISTTGDPIPQFLRQDIEQRFVFLNNLLSAEIASSPSKPHHLHHIAHRLADLESTFRDLYTGAAPRRRSLTSEGGTPVIGDLETNSNCSCTESCLNEDEEEGWGEMITSGGLESPEGFYAMVEEQPAVGERERGAGKREKGGVWERRDWVVMGSGIIIGAVLMGIVMVKFCGGFHHYIERQGFVAPT